MVSQGATALLSWGCAAALDDRLSAGCLILPERIIGTNGEIHRVNTEWHRRIYQTLESKHPIRTEALVESDAIMKTSARKASAGQTDASGSDRYGERSTGAACQRARTSLYGDPGHCRHCVNRYSRKRPEGTRSARRYQSLENSHWQSMPADWIKIVRLGIQFNAAQRTLKKRRERCIGFITVLIYAPLVFRRLDR